jgi:hypothetical protein
MFTDAYLWSPDCFLQPTSHARASRGRRGPIGTVRRRTAGSSVACTTRQLLVVSLLGLLEHLLSLLNIHLAGRNIYGCQDGASRFRSFLEILQRLGPSHNSLGKNSALLGQPLLFNHLEDRNNVHKVFLVVPMGVDGHAEVGRVRKLDLEDLGFFLGHDDVYHRNVRNGQPMRQLLFLALSILQPVHRLEGGTHFGVMPESGT